MARRVLLLAAVLSGHGAETSVVALGSAAGPALCGTSDDSRGLTRLAHLAGSLVANVSSARELLRQESTRLPEASDGFSLAIFPGSWNPPTHAHVAAAQAVMDGVVGLDAVWLDMAVHVGGEKAHVDSFVERRLELAALAVEGVVHGASATSLGPNIADPHGAEYFEVVRALASGIGGSASRGRVTWVVGSDVAMAMRRWRDKARHLMMMVDEVAVVLRNGHTDEDVRSLLGELLQPSGPRSPKVTTLRLSDRLEGVSSTVARAATAELLRLAPRAVLERLFAPGGLAELYGEAATRGGRP